TAPGDLAEYDKTAVSVTLTFGATTTESNFREYIIYYKVGSSGVTENDSAWASSSDANLGDILYNGATSTTIINLSAGTQYVFNIWAYDQAGNKASSSGEVNIDTNTLPTGSFSSAVSRTDGSGVVDISIVVDDADDDDSRAKIEYVLGADCDFSSPGKATLDETDANATSTYGDAKIDNNLAYQIGSSTGWIITSNGANAVNFDWLSATDLPTGDGVYCLRLTANDRIEDQATPATTTVVIDNAAPTAPGDLTLVSRTGTTLTLGFGATSSETHFDRYRIFYKQGAATVNESDTEHTDSNLLDQNYNGATTTMITGLSPNTQYSFKIYAYDTYGHKSSSNQVTFTTNAPPTGSFNSVAEKTDGSGRVDISIEVYDTNGDEARAKIEFATGTACDFTSPGDPTLDENSANISADYGQPGIDNSLNYQIGTPTAMIITSSGSNTVNFDWLSAADLPSANGTYCLRLTVNDGIDDQISVATTTVTVDNVSPTAPGSLTVVSVSGLSITLGFGAAGADTNFSEYKIFYKAASSSVSESDNEWNKNNDSNLGYLNYNGATTTTITGLEQNTTYVFNIWIYDAYGHKASATTEVSTTTLIVPTATWRENEDTVSPTDSPYVNKEETVRLRIAVVNSKDWVADNYRYQLEFGRKNGTCANVSSWTVVPTATGTPAFGMVASPYFDNYASTTARLANAEGYSFTPGYLLESPANITGGISLNGLYYTEIEYTIAPTTNAKPGETYCFRVTNNGTPLDDYEIYPELRLAPPPTSSFVYARQKNDGSNIVDITIQANDLNGDDLRAKLEFATGTACDFTSIGDPTLDETDENITATYGDPAIDNNSFYQIGTGTDMIVTQYGTNTVSFDWNTPADLPNADGTYCLRLTVNDGYDNQTPLATTTVVVDHISPTTPGD
ncbi:MAG: hypothetical protein DRP15_03785, partial [Candidatus Aenigmatarchaeota archaeon]